MKVVLKSRADGAGMAIFAAGIGHHRKGIPLQTVIVVKTQRFVLNHALVQLKTRLLQALFAPGMAAVQYRHVVLLRHFIDGSKQAGKVLLCVYVFFPMGRKQNVFALFQAQTRMDVAGFNLCKVLVEHLSHGTTSNIGAFFGQAVLCKITTSVFYRETLGVQITSDSASQLYLCVEHKIKT